MLSRPFILVQILLLAYLIISSRLLFANENPSNDSEQSVKLITFKLLPTANIFKFALATDKITEQVSHNLAQWQYPVKTGKQNYSHSLEAQIDKISHQETPVGFSFSAGNSDPRASDYQKADVLPISCRLTDIKTGKLVAEQKATFSEHLLSNETDQQKLTEQLVNQISTACYNLLEDKHIAKVVDDSNKAVVSTWHPQIRVQTIQPQTVQKNPINGEASIIEEAKKQIIIENQGTPVIFELGHERR